jgi:hypothetical protein
MRESKKRTTVTKTEGSSFLLFPTEEQNSHGSYSDLIYNIIFFIVLYCFFMFFLFFI